MQKIIGCAKVVARKEGGEGGGGVKPHLRLHGVRAFAITGEAQAVGQAFGAAFCRTLLKGGKPGIEKGIEVVAV